MWPGARAPRTSPAVRANAAGPAAMASAAPARPSSPARPAGRRQRDHDAGVGRYQREADQPDPAHRGQRQHDRVLPLAGPEDRPGSADALPRPDPVDHHPAARQHDQGGERLPGAWSRCRQGCCERGVRGRAGAGLGLGRVRGVWCERGLGGGGRRRRGGCGRGGRWGGKQIWRGERGSGRRPTGLRRVGGGAGAAPEQAPGGVADARPTGRRARSPPAAGPARGWASASRARPAGSRCRTTSPGPPPPVQSEPPGG